MGIVRMGIPEDISIFIKERNMINHFVETGTFHGGTSIWASQYFKKVETIEFSYEIYNQTKEKNKDIENINFIFGDSRSALKTILNNSTESILFWLDAHWCSAGSYGEKDQCPLIEELKIINSSPLKNFILVDDARLFMAPPPLPNLIEFYPTINEIVEVLKDQFIIIFEDVLFILPKSFQTDFCNFIQIKTSKVWTDRRDNIAVKPAIKKTPLISKTKSLIKLFLRT